MFVDCALRSWVAVSGAAARSIVASPCQCMPQLFAAASQQPLGSLLFGDSCVNFRSHFKIAFVSFGFLTQHQCLSVSVLAALLEEVIF